MARDDTIPLALQMNGADRMKAVNGLDKFIKSES
jgi:hypothetical protein